MLLKKTIKILFGLILMMSVSDLYAQSSNTILYNDIVYKVISEEENLVEVTGFSKEATDLPDDLVIPDQIEVSGETYTVVSIGQSAFIYSKIVTAIIPSTVTEIRPMAFMSCYNLESIKIPDSVKSIGYSALSGCNFTEINLPASVTEIGSQCFTECQSLENILVDSENPCYSSIDGILFNKDGSELISCGGGRKSAIIIPESTVSIADFAFWACTGIEEIILPESLESIGAFALSNCKNLKSITIPSNVTYIGGYAFLYCNSLSYVELPAGIDKIDEWGVFGGCYSLETMVCHAIFPPESSFAAFATDTYGEGWNGDNRLSLTDCTLYVPALSVDYYLTSSPWNLFYEVLPLEDAGVTDIIPDNNSGIFNVYNTAGVKVMTTRDKSEIRKLPRGVYIVNGKKIAI